MVVVVVGEGEGGQSSPRVSVAWASGSLSWALLHRPRVGRLLIDVRLSCHASVMSRFLAPTPVDKRAWCSLNMSRGECTRQVRGLVIRKWMRSSARRPCRRLSKLPQSAAREVAYATLLSRVLSAAEAGQAVRLP